MLNIKLANRYNNITRLFGNYKKILKHSREITIAITENKYFFYGKKNVLR